jgi:hypothetical protein
MRFPQLDKIPSEERTAVCLRYSLHLPQKPRFLRLWAYRQAHLAVFPCDDRFMQQPALMQDLVSVRDAIDTRFLVLHGKGLIPESFAAGWHRYRWFRLFMARTIGAEPRNLIDITRLDLVLMQGIVPRCELEEQQGSVRSWCAAYGIRYPRSYLRGALGPMPCAVRSAIARSAEQAEHYLESLN